MSLTIFLILILLFILAGISCFFSSSETAVIGLSKIRLRNLVNKGVRHAKSIQKLVTQLDKFIAAILIGNDFVNIAISAIMLEQIEQFVQQPGTPNLYWALTAMPQPFIDIRKAMQYEKDALYTEFPQLKDIETAKLTPREVSNLLNDFMRKMGEIGIGIDIQLKKK